MPLHKLIKKTCEKANKVFDIHNSLWQDKSMEVRKSTKRNERGNEYVQ